MAPLSRSAREPVSLRKRACIAGLLAFAAMGGHAGDAGWFDAGDTQLRMDLQLLNDAEIIRYPVNQWPIPRAGVQYALADAKEHFATNAAVKAALERVRARATPARRLDFAIGISAGEPGLMRDFDTLAREEGDLGAELTYDKGRFAVGLDVAMVANPTDGDELRADGSHATVRWGNWLLSANLLDRWWGPGHTGSLILSNNARPMPTFMVERAEARAFESVWLNWLGPWRMSFGIGQLENSRQDIDSPLFMAWRVVVMPFRKIELGFSRTAQFCGKQLECNLDVFGNMLAGNDNVGIDATEENEPGNQMAGFDIRWNSPLGSFPYAIYAQYIGEDESSYLPAKYLSQLGVEMWKPMVDGGILLGFLEYTSTTCSANSGRGPYYGCAYNQGLFNIEGYRYKGRVIGYTSDRDAENWALGASWQATDGELWTATARTSRLNRATEDFRNTVAQLPTAYDSLELGWKGRLFGQHLRVDVGAESIEPRGGERDIGVFGFISWRYEFPP